MTNLPTTDISQVNLDQVFLHYTDKTNLSTIAEYGLVPRIGDNSKGLEKSPKIFFTIGDKGALVIMDVWLKWLLSRPKNPLIYRLGAFFMTQAYFPKFIYKIIFSKWHNSPKRFTKTCQTLKTILDNSVFLVLNLEEEVDFNYTDIDEVKAQKFPKTFLKDIYSYGSDLSSDRMEFWNMHTISGRTISRQKLSILTIDGKSSASSIIEHLASNNGKYIQKNCPRLSEYLSFIAS